MESLLEHQANIILLPVKGTRLLNKVKKIELVMELFKTVEKQAELNGDMLVSTPKKGSNG